MDCFSRTQNLPRSATIARINDGFAAIIHRSGSPLGKDGERLNTGFASSPYPVLRCEAGFSSRPCSYTLPLCGAECSSPGMWSPFVGPSRWRSFCPFFFAPRGRPLPKGTGPVAIDISAEQTISLTEATWLLPSGRKGRPVHLSCVLRWITNGSSAPGGRRVRLEAVRLGGRWITSREALARFAEALTPRFDQESAPAPRSPSKRQQASQHAAKQLESIGIY